MPDSLPPAFSVNRIGPRMRAQLRTAALAMGVATFAASRCVLAQTPIPFAEKPCTPEGGFEVICGQRHPEDMVRVPEASWVVATWYDDAGGLRAINTRDKTSVALYPADTAKERHDRKTYASCPGALSGHDKARYYTGIALKPGSKGVHRIYAIHRGNRTSVEVFELDVRRKSPVATWIGCAVAPEGVYLNAVTATPEGGFIASNYYTMGSDPAAARARMEAGGVSGEALEWRPRSGWAKVPGSDASGANGVELSRDGQWLYVNEFGSRSIFRVSRGTSPPKRQDLKVPFRPDNLHWASDGTLLTAGRVDGGGWVVQIDPITLEPTRLAELPNSQTFFNASVVIDVDDAIWVGSSRSDRIVILPSAKQRR